MRRCKQKYGLFHATFGMLSLTVCGAALICVPNVLRAQSLSELRAAHKAAYDPHALQLLKQMSDAYAHLTFFDQQTDFYSLQTPVKGSGEEEEKRRKGEKETEQGTGNREQGTENNQSAIRNRQSAIGNELPRMPVEKPAGRAVRLIVAGNRLRLDMIEEGDADTPPKTATTLSDGKTLFVYNPVKNWYTQTKAPRSLRDFQKVANLGSSTLELMMLMGLTPFADVESQFDAVKYEGVGTVHGSPADVVLLRAELDKQIQELRFYIDPDTNLLRRLVVETTPIVHELTAPKRNPLDDLIPHPAVTPTETPGQIKPDVAPGFEDPRPIAPPGAPMYVRLTCDNTFTLSPRLEPDTFVFKPPTGATLYQDVNNSSDFSKMSTPLSVQELVKQQMKQMGQSTKSVKKSKPIRVKL